MQSGQRPSSDGYILRRGFAASARLNLMHYLWKEHTGNLLHQRISDAIAPETAKIAEIGTGTGIWIVDLAKTLPPTAQLDGFDISLKQCPPQGFLPRNVTFSELDALGPIPDHLIGKYDVVYIRHFLLVVRNSDPSAVIQNVMKMLSGYVQWCEMDFSTMRYVGATPDSSTKAIEDLYNYIGTVGKKESGSIRAQSHWPATLNRKLEDIGMVDISVDRLRYDKAYLPFQLDTGLLTWEELTYMAIDRVGEAEGRKARELILAAYDEGRAGGAWDTDRVIVVARKPWGRPSEVDKRFEGEQSVQNGLE